MAEESAVADTILVVDDDLNGVKLLGVTLQAEGFEVLTAGSGGEALSRIEAETPDLVILDVMMPGMSGLEVCRRVRESSQTADLPVIMLTARSEVADRVEGLRLGADDFIPKPASPAEVVARVRAVLTRARRRSTTKAKVVSFLGAKGGVGTSTVAANVAIAMAEAGKGVILIDFRSDPGTLGLQMGLISRTGLTTLLAMEPDQIDDQQVKSCLVSYHAGLRVLAASQAPSDPGDVPAPHAQRILDAVRSSSEYVLVDLPIHSSLGREVVLTQSDLTVIVVEPEPIAVACAQMTLARMRESSPARALGLVIVNRNVTSVPLTLSEVRDAIPATLVAVIPHTSDGFNLAQRQGIPLMLAQPHNLAAVALKELADRLGRWHIFHQRA
jgi:CheY-like chemotaxis protein/MinD-like ATPase involved in chromosome partitioning or flagellar assembly